jgi:hypothetical protein
MSYAQSKLFTEGPSRHEEPEEKLWRQVIESAVRDAVAGSVRARLFFSSESWRLVSKELLCPASITRIEALVFAAPVRTIEPANTRAKQTPEERKQLSRIRAREAYRKKVGFYDRANSPLQEVTCGA